MPINPRRQRHFKKVLTFIILFLALGMCLIFLNLLISLRKPLYLSPLGKTNADTVSLEKLLKKSSIPFTEVILSGNFYSISLQNSGKVRISQDKDFTRQVTSLQRILRELTIEGKSFKVIDFRFSEPTISF